MRWGMRPSWVGMLLVALIAVTAAAQGRDDGARSERRIALVIGNSDYEQARLRNPVNDARALGQALRRAGFEVIARENADRVAMYEAITAFGDRLKETGGVGLFYFSGHGLQAQGRNFVVPVGARINSERMIETEAIDVNRVLGEMDTARARVNIVILDACRDNPYARSFRSGSRGLAQIDAPRGTMIAYATAPGKVAQDGSGQNSPYTAALVKHIATPGLAIESVFKRVRIEVLEQTANRQEPWEASSLTGDFFFQPEFGSLAVSARLEGVEVWLGDRRLGETRSGRPLLVENLAAGNYRVKARKAGHSEWERDIQVAANQRAEIVIDIDALGPVRVTRGDDGAEMVLVPAGEFWMGSGQQEIKELLDFCSRYKKHTYCTGVDFQHSELPRHRVMLNAFFIDRHKVTNALFDSFIKAKEYRTTAEQVGYSYIWLLKDGVWKRLQVSNTTWRTPSGPGSTTAPTHPAVHVSWHDASAFCKWAGKRLPREAEWEKAARGTLGHRYPWGDEWNASRASISRAVDGTTPVDHYKRGASPYGAYDMIGNVYEWVADWYDDGYYGKSPVDNPSGPATGVHRAVRGGWWGSAPEYSRAASRWRAAPTYTVNIFGFRCAKDAPLGQ